jgi:hypothetical protein
MGVKSARVQQVIQGDDVVLRHAIVGPVAVGNNESVALVSVDVGDVVKAFYESTQPTDESLPAVPPVQATGVAVVGSPSTFDFSIPSADSEKILAGLSKTVRIEITRLSGSLETYYLFDEVDVLKRGWPVEGQAPLSLP